MEKIICEQCNREFGSAESLNQHNKVKHNTETHAQGTEISKRELRQLKKQERKNQVVLGEQRLSRSKLIRRTVYIIILVAVIGVGAFGLISYKSAIENTSYIISSDVPQSAIHWHLH